MARARGLAAGARAWPCGVLLAALALAGCTRHAGSEAAPVTIDGRFDDWRRDQYLRADESTVAFRLVLPDERTLQAAPDSVVVDVGEAFGIAFSPRASEGQGVALRARPEAGGDAKLGHAAIDLVVAPTFAAREFELRFAREVRGRPDLTAALDAGKLRVQARVERADGTVAWRGPAYELELPPRAAATEDADAMLPAAGPGELRVVSWNVYVAKPRKEPEPFARVLRALAPDVVLLQEWEGATPDELAAFFDAHLPGDPPWHALTSAGWGVAVVARAPWERLGPETVARPDDAPADPHRGDQALRLAAGVAATRRGRVCAASLHLKCCGSAESGEDAARRAEARLANELLATALRDAGDCMRVVGGDLNLVGSRAPLDILGAGLASDGGALATADTLVLGDRAVYTWSQAWSRFSPGRLDWLLYDGAASSPARAFVLDARRLDRQSLAAAGLARDDAQASDHLPLVMDLVHVRAGPEAAP